MPTVEHIYYYLPSGNISVVFIEKCSEIPYTHSFSRSLETKPKEYFTRTEVGLDIDDVRDLFDKTKEFLEWYDNEEKE